MCPLTIPGAPARPLSARIALRAGFQADSGRIQVRIAGKSSDLAQALGPGQHHHQAVDPEPDAAGRRHPLFERLDEGLVVGLRLLVAAAELGRLLLEAPALLVGVVELGEGVGDLDPADEGLPALDQALLGAVGLGEGRELDRVVEDEGRLDQAPARPRLESSPSTSLPQPSAGSGSVPIAAASASRVGCSAMSMPARSRIASRRVIRRQGGAKSISTSPRCDLRSSPAPARRPRRPAARGRARSSRSRRRPRTTRAS